MTTMTASRTIWTALQPIRMSSRIVMGNYAEMMVAAAVVAPAAAKMRALISRVFANRTAMAKTVATMVAAAVAGLAVPIILANQASVPRIVSVAVQVRPAAITAAA